MSAILTFFATAPRGLTALLAEELHTLEGQNIREHPGGVDFSGTLELAYRACLWLRTANRVLLPLADFAAPDPDALYAAATDFIWEDHIDPAGSFAVEVAGQSAGINHSHYAAQRVKDAVADRFRARCGTRPRVDLARPDLRIHLHLHENHNANLSIDLSGTSLHQRGYRQAGGDAPLKENLAAGILLRAGWPALAKTGAALVDPLSGSGTFLIEGAFIAGDRAPGLRRNYWGFLGWLGHIPALWKRLQAEAEERARVGFATLPALIGFDAAPEMVRAANANIARAGLQNRITITVHDLATFPQLELSPGLVVINPPYGERLGNSTELTGLYSRIGEILRAQFSGWEAALFTGNLSLAKNLGIRAWRMHPLDNGALACHLLRFHLTSEWWMNTRQAPKQLITPTETKLSSGAEMFANRLRKNLKELSSWARRTGVSCYRLYDADMPEYAVAIDLYQGAQRWIHCQEYAAPSTINPDKAALHFSQIQEALPIVLEIPPAQIFFKVRTRQKDFGQYQRLGKSGIFHEVQEGDCTFFVNFTDHLDTGLFLDQRSLRVLIRNFASGLHFLNLYSYTGTATVQAAAGGAITTTSVDLSGNYLSWARRNFARNGFLISNNSPHEFINADVLSWLTEMTQLSERRRYGLIFLSPPTFSRSKRMAGVFDLQRDHISLLRTAAQLLDPNGVIIFAPNSRRFWLDQAQLINSELTCEDISAQTLAHDFARNPRIHQSWRIAKYAQ